MNDQDLNAGLHSLYGDRMAAPAPSELRVRAWAVPDSVPPGRRKWSPRIDTGKFGAMFGAMKLGAAGLVIAVFGGFLLLTVLPGQPNEDPLPAASVSPTVSPSAEPSRVELLPNVELDFQMINPGFYRVLGDGQRGLTRNVRDVAVSPSGDVFVVKYGVVRVPEEGDPGGYSPFYRNIRVLQLGEAGVSRRSVPNHEGGLVSDTWGLESGDGGVILQAGGRAWQFDGQRWSRFFDEASGPCGQQAWGVRARPAADGECWGLWGNEPMLSRVGDDGQWRGHGLEGADFGLRPETRIGEQFVITDDGVVVTTVREGPFAGLLSGFGDSWSFIPYQGDGPFRGDGVASLGRQETLGIAPDGTVWVTNLGDGKLTVASWDGQEWRSYGPVEVESYPAVDDTRLISRVTTYFLDDGRVWFSPLAMFDGLDLQAVNLLDGIGNDKPGLKKLVRAPDGSAWAVIIADRDQDEAEGSVDSGLYVIRPDELTYAK